jgi:hypothetical protein
MRFVRTSGEILGVAGVLALHFFIIIFYALGSGLIRDRAGVLAYWTGIALGYVAMGLVAGGRRRTLGDLPWRVVLDAWLLAFPLAVMVTATLVSAKWPLRFTGWDAHGMGATGGEANALFLPWLHLLGWWLVGRAWHRWHATPR